MISIDTNVLLPAIVRESPLHAVAREFLESLQGSEGVAISEFVLQELYNLLRNPAVMGKPLSAAAAVGVCQSFRNHSKWQTVGFPTDSRDFHDAYWPRLADEHFAQRRAYDWRIALTLLRQGVTEFATVNVKDFQDFGFRNVWSPF